MKQKWWILLTLLLCGCGASSQPDQTGAVQNDRPRLSASMEETAENVAAVEKNENLEKNPSNSNQNPGEGQNWTVFAMDTVMQFDAYGGSANLQEKVKRRVEELEGELSTTQENSDIFHLNQEKTAELSADTRYLMQEALALGADGVLIGRPFVTMVYGGGEEGVAAYVRKLTDELSDTMAMCGAHSLKEINREMLWQG